MFSARHLAIVALAALPLVSQAAPTNLLRNGDFEAFDYVDPDRDPTVHVPSQWQITGRTSGYAGGDWFADGVLSDTTADYGDISGGSGSRSAVLFNLASLSQTFTVSNAGEYRISWLDAGAQDLGAVPWRYYGSVPDAGGLHYQVSLGGQVLGQFATTLGQDFTSHSFTAQLAPGSYTLSFTGLDEVEWERFGGADQYTRQTLTHIALFDQVGVAAVPEPQTYALLLLGLSGLGWRARRARKSA